MLMGVVTFVLVVEVKVIFGQRILLPTHTSKGFLFCTGIPSSLVSWWRWDAILLQDSCKPNTNPSSQLFVSGLLRQNKFRNLKLATEHCSKWWITNRTTKDPVTNTWVWYPKQAYQCTAVGTHSDIWTKGAFLWHNFCLLLLNASFFAHLLIFSLVSWWRRDAILSS